MSLPSSVRSEQLDICRPNDVRSALTIFRQSFVDAWLEARLRELLERPDMFGITLRMDGLMCGCLLYRFVDNLQEIVTLGVLLDARRLGVASLLIQRAKLQGRRTDATIVAMRESNTPARLCFEKAGFQFAMKLRDYYGQGHPADLLYWDRPDTRDRSPRRARKKT